MQENDITSLHPFSGFKTTSVWRSRSGNPTVLSSVEEEGVRNYYLTRRIDLGEEYHCGRMVLYPCVTGVQ